MPMAHSIAHRKTPIALFAVRLILALLFGAAGVAKLMGVAPLIVEFDAIGVGQWFRYLTGFIEIVSAALALSSACVGLGFLLMLGVCVGAFLAQVFILHGDAIHTVVLAAASAGMAWAYRRQFRTTAKEI